MSQSTANQRPIITHYNPKSPISEAYRTLRTNIQFSAVDDEINTIMVTSAGPGEGKSTTVTNLAVVYAQAGKRVLIIDADLRKPTMHHTFSMSNRRGLTNVLAAQTNCEDAIQLSEIDNLSILTSGPIPPNPSEILASKRMTQLFGELTSLYDVVFVDVPPVLVVTDAQIVASKCKGVLIVIDSGKVKKEIALKSKALLERVNARILGVVLNNLNRNTGDMYYYYYYGKKEE